MKNILLPCLLALAIAGCHSARPLQSPPLPAQSAPNGSTLIIYYDATIGKAKLLEAAQQYKATVIYQYNELNGIAVTIPASATQEEAMRFFQNVPGVVSVQPDGVNKLY